MNPDQIFGYVVMLSASLLLVSVGSLLCFAPRKFTELGRWWGRQIGFPQLRYDWNVNRRMTWLNWRLPGIGLLCFGAFLLFVILRSMIRDGVGPLSISRAPSVVDHHPATWVQLALDMIPIVLGLLVLARTEAILSRAKQSFFILSDSADGPKLARYFFKAIGFLAIIAGFAFLLRHIL